MSCRVQQGALHLADAQETFVEFLTFFRSRHINNFNRQVLYRHNLIYSSQENNDINEETEAQRE